MKQALSFLDRAIDRTVVVGAAGLLALTGVIFDVPAARADGEVTRRPSAQPAPAAGIQPKWTGGQAGGFGGGSQLNASFVEPGANLCPGPHFTITGTTPTPTGVSANHAECRETPFAFDSSKTTFTGGVLLGYAVQLGSFVVGLEGDFALKHASTSGAIDPVSTVELPGGGNSHTRTEVFKGKHTQKYDASLRARLGVLLTPDLLAYATGGLAVGKVCGSFAYDADIDNQSTSRAQAYGSESWCKHRFGYTAGGGLEVAVGQGWKARVEYRYTDLGSDHRNIPLRVTRLAGTTCGTSGYNCTGNARVDVDSAFHTLRLGLAYTFTGPF